MSPQLWEAVGQLMFALWDLGPGVTDPGSSNW